MNDKNIEETRYNDRAAKFLESSEYVKLTLLPLYLQPPTNSYKSLLKSIPLGCRVLEIGAGMGENTELMLELGLNVLATDISPKSVKVMANRFAEYKTFRSEVADMEDLKFDDNSFDVVCAAGSLSYGDNKLVRDQIYRVLKKGGTFIALDSLNNNPIFRLNRYLHYMIGNRSKSTLLRMPNTDLISSYIGKFGHANVVYFGSITYLFPLLNKFMSDESITALSNSFDKKLNIKKSAFKFTMKVLKL